MKKDRKEKGNVPNLRFPEFEGEWENRKLGDVGEIISGLTYNPDDIDENGVLVLRSSNIQNRNIDFTDNVFVNTINYNPVKENDILICVRNGSKNLIGKNALIRKENEGLAFGAFMSVYRSPYNRFIFQWFDTNEYKKIVHTNLGATINSINGSDLKKFIIPFPKVEEQDKIAAFLSLIDQRIETQNKIIEELKRLKTALVDGLYNPTTKRNSHLRFPEFQEEWDKTTLGNITENFNRRNKEQVDYPMYSVTNNQGFVPQSEKFGDREMVGENICSYKIIESGEFAYNPARINVGSIARYNGDSFCMISSLYVCFKLKDNIDSNWALHLLESRRINFYYDVYGEGGVRIYLFYPNFSRIKVSVPKFNEQIKIGKLISKIDKRINIEINLGYKYKCQKSALLKQMFI